MRRRLSACSRLFSRLRSRSGQLRFALSGDGGLRGLALAGELHETEEVGDARVGGISV
jgi:hypothetical protein